MPTEAELNGERTNFLTNDALGAFNSPLKLTLPGYRHYLNGALSLVHTFGYCWSSTVSGTSAHRLKFGSTFANMDASTRGYGFSVRCLKE